MAGRARGASGRRAGADARRRRRGPPARARRGPADRALRGAHGHDVRRACARGCCATRRWRPGSIPFATPVAAADRLAMLLERIDDLPLRHHDLRGNPSGTLGAIVRRVDRLKDELISAADYAAWAGSLPDDARGAREREFAALFAAHDELLADAGALDVGDLVLQAFRLLREKPHVRSRLAARYGHVLIDELQDASLRPGAAAAAAGRRARRDQRVRRRRPGDPPLPRRGDQEHPRLPRGVAAGDDRAPGRVAALRRAAAGGRGRGRGADRGPAGQDAGRDAGRAGRRGRVLALHVRARAGAGRGGRGRAADLARGRRARGRLRAGALGARRGPGRGGRVRGARGAVPPERGGGVLPARRGARPAGLAAAAGRPGRRGRGRAGAGAAAGRAAGDRPRARDPDRAPAQARHGRGFERRPGVAADPARGARPDRLLPQALPVRGLRPGLLAPGPVRAPAGRAARAAPAAAVRGHDRGRRAAAQPRALRRARGRVRAPRAAGHRARVRPLDRGRRRRRAARGGGGGRRGAPAACA